MRKSTGNDNKLKKMEQGKPREFVDMGRGPRTRTRPGSCMQRALNKYRENPNDKATTKREKMEESSGCLPLKNSRHIPETPRSKVSPVTAKKGPGQILRRLRSRVSPEEAKESSEAIRNSSSRSYSSKGPRVTPQQGRF